MGDQPPRGVASPPPHEGTLPHGTRATREGPPLFPLLLILVARQTMSAPRAIRSGMTVLPPRARTTR